MQHHDISISGRAMALSVLRMLRPHAVGGLSKIRVGRLYDGGYVMLDDFANITAAYSFGINDDVSWDLDIARRAIPVFQYDHTIDSLPQSHPLFTWRKKGVGGGDDGQASLESIENIIKENGHEDATEMLLKCDIEGAEWLALRVTPAQTLRKFRQIVVEIHNLERLAIWPHSDNIRATFFNLTAFHKIVHVHANNFAPWVVVGGIPLPSVLELTLARIDCGQFALSEEVFPTDLDMPCDAAHADLHLGRFIFP